MNDTWINDIVEDGEQPCSHVVEIFTLVFYPLVMMLGLPGNCLILRVYWAKPFKTSTTVLIMGLAWADLFSCLFMVFRVASSCLLINQPPGLWYARCTDFLLFTAIASSLMITSVIAFDRYDCVCRPQRRFFNRKRATVAAVCCVLYSTLINFPGIIEIFAPSPLTGIITLVFQVLCFVSALFMIVICYKKVYTTIRKHVKTGNNFRPKFAKSGESSSPKNGMMTSFVVHNKTQNISKDLEDKKPPSNNASKIISVNSPIIKNAWTQSSNGNKDKPASAQDDTSKISEDTTNAGMQASASASTPVDPSYTTNLVPVSSESSNKAPEEKPSIVPKQPAQGMQRRTTRMLLMTSIVFLISWMPRWAYVALLIADQLTAAVVHPDVMLVVGLSSLLEFINHAVNPIIYGLANRRFRKDAKVELQKLKVRC